MLPEYRFELLVHPLADESRGVVINDYKAQIFKDNKIAEEVSIRPRSKEVFLEILKYLNIQNWNNDYTCEDSVFDGFYWKLTFESKESCFTSSGFNAYPDTKNASDGSTKINIIAIALDSLIEKKHLAFIL